MDEKKLFEKSKTVKDLATGMAVYSSASIFGPLVIFGLIGYFLDKTFNTKPLIMIIGVFIAFVATNILLFKKLRVLVKDFEKYDKTQNQDKSKNAPERKEVDDYDGEDD